MLCHWCPEQSNAKPLVKWRDLLSGQWKGPDPLLTSGRVYACIFPIWVPDRLIHHVSASQILDSPSTAISKKEEASSTPAPSTSTDVLLTSEIPDEQGTEPPTRQMSQLHIRDIASPNSLPRRRPPGHPAQSTQLASIPTWGQIKALCHRAQGILSLQGSSVSPEKVFLPCLLGFLAR